jgi:transcriptional regulator with XRE-family HTH domain
MVSESEWKKGRGEVIRANRKAKGLSQQQLADILGVSKNSVSKYEKGGGYDYEVAEKMARCFGLQTETLWMPDKLQESKPEVFNTKPKGIAYYNMEASAGPIEMFQDDSEIAEQISIPGFQDCDIAINVWGDSMYPHYRAGNMIICKEVFDKGLIAYGEVYLVITSEFRTIKYIRKNDNKELVTLRSANDKYDDVEVELDKIIKLYHVKGKIERNAI